MVSPTWPKPWSWPAKACPFLSHNEVSKTWDDPYSPHAHISGSSLLTTVDDADLYAYSKLHLIEEAIAAGEVCSRAP